MCIHGISRGKKTARKETKDYVGKQQEAVGSILCKHSIYIYIYVYVCIFMYVYIIKYVYIYI